MLPYEICKAYANHCENDKNQAHLVKKHGTGAYKSQIHYVNAPMKYGIHDLCFGAEIRKDKPHYLLKKRGLKILDYMGVLA